MATRSRIAIEDQTGKVRSIYCHWDGYPSNNGRILLEHFQTQEKVESLIKLGSISSLNKNVEIPEGVTHNFGSPADGIVVAYHRDRREDLEIRDHDSVGDFVNSDVEEYGYIFTAAGEWLCVDAHEDVRQAKLLENILIKEAEQVGWLKEFTIRLRTQVRKDLGFLLCLIIGKKQDVVGETVVNVPALRLRGKLS